MDSILIIEDEQGLARSLSYALTQAGYQTRVAVTGSEGLEALEQSLPSLILLDLILPGVSGIEVLKLIKKNPRTAAIPVMVLTNVETTEMVGEVVSVGKVDYLIKSNYALDEIVERVRIKLSEQA